MSLSCVLCGGPLGHARNETWLNEFRSIYTTGYDWHNPCLSGVGLVEGSEYHPQFNAPPWFEDRYDDQGFATENAIRILPSPVFEPIPGGAPPDVQPWGFFFHAACWELLRAETHPQKVDIRVLNDILRSCPRPEGTINWGHTYGGIYASQNGNWMNGTGIRLGHRLGYYRYPDNPNPEIVLHRQDPLNVTPIRDIIEQSKAQNFERLSISIRAPFSTDTRNFAILPLELRELILCFLPSPDVRSLMLASRAFASIQLSQTFWASRFDNDYDYIFEVRKDLPRGTPCNWKFLFENIKGAVHNLPAIRNRKRIWELLRSLTDAVVTLSQSPLKGLPARTFFDPEIARDSKEWNKAVKSRDSNLTRFSYGSVALYSRTVFVNQKVVGVYVSFFEMAGTTFVSGIRFICSDGQHIELGYIIGKTEVYLSVGTCALDDGISTFRGFKVTIGERGIQAIAVASHPNASSPLAGAHEGIPKRLLASYFQDIREVRAGFDGFKLVSLDIPSDTEPQSSLRETFCWLPDIPHHCWNLHGDCFVGCASIKRHPEWPLTYLHFGGHGGRHLGNLVSLSAWEVSGTLMGIEVQYGHPIDGATIRDVGYCGTYNERKSALISRKTKVKEEKTTFEIDGPGGERIVAVELCDVKSREQGTEPWFRITTNRDRAVYFPESMSPQHGHPKVIKPEGSKAITGFYSVESHFYSILPLKPP
ncbi:hypothetical protein AJ79_08714 [Helicocarpus griseus UAMH5409]|uniref:F-box domain-containing protein n=1 Tax=Helicocarpus griseus UAMH5409 TaxID=1447875 RepID=A0A2B7WQI2_9EURO|nr:hypothetical protein AJ79_08714 [Helicocarpus griseus UAMH5409]